MRRIIFPIMLLLLLLVGCASPELDNRLATIEQMMSEQPNSALYLLKEIDSKQINNRRQRAWHALLYSQALDKNFIDSTNDSIINIAVEYYENHGDDRYRGMAYYYKSRIYENSGLYDDATEYSILAEKALQETNEYYMMALVWGNRGDIYAEQYRFLDAIDLLKKAILYYEKCNDLKRVAYVHLQLSNIFMQKISTDSALHHHDIAHRIGEKLNDTELLYDVENYRASYYEYRKEYDKAMLTLRNALKQYPAHQPNADDYHLMARYFYHIGQNDSALYYLDNYYAPLCQTYSDFENMYLFKSIIYKDMGNLSTAYELLAKYVNYKVNNGLFEQNKSIPELERKYKTELLAQESKSLKTRNQLLLIISILAGVLVVLFCYLYYQQRKLRIEQYYQLSKSTQESVTEIQQQYNTIKKQLELHKSQKQLADNAIAARIENMKTLIDVTYLYSTKNDLFYKKCKSYIEMCDAGDKSFLRDVREIASLIVPNFVDILQNNHPCLNNEDINFCCLTILGFEIKHLQVLYNHNQIQATYKRRERLLKKLRVDDRQELRDFLLSLSQNSINN